LVVPECNNTDVARGTSLNASRRTTVKGTEGSTITNLSARAWIAKGLTAYLIMISAQALVLSVILRIPFAKFLLPIALLVFPALFFMPFVYLSRRRGGRRLGLFLAGVLIFAVLFQLALDYSAYILGYLSQNMARGLIPFILFSIVPVSLSLYFYVRLRKRAKSEPREDRG
jgi:hypothetical protein